MDEPAIQREAGDGRRYQVDHPVWTAFPWTLLVLAWMWVWGVSAGTVCGQTLQDLPRIQDTFFNHFNAGQYRQALPPGRQLLAICERNYQQRPLNIAAACNNLANTLDALAEYDEAVELHERALAIRQQNLAGTDQLVGESHNNLGVALLHAGKWDEAETHLKRSLTIRRQRHAPNSLEIAEGLNNLAILANERQDFATSEKHYLRALQIKQSLFGTNHPQVAVAWNNLGGLYHAMGRLAEAEEMLRKSLAVQKKQPAPNQLDLADCYNDLGVVLQERGAWVEAESLLKQAVRIRQSKLDPDHPLVAASITNLAIVYSGQNRFRDAERFYKRALRIVESRVGAGSTQALEIRNNLAVVYKQQQRYPEAESLYQTSLEKVPNDRSALKAALLNNLASVNEVQGRTDEAERYYRQALEIWRQTGALLDVARVANNLANLCYHDGRHEDALHFVEQALKLRRAGAAGPGDLHFSHRVRAQILQAMQRPEEAISDYQKAIELAEQQRAFMSGSDQDRAAASADHAVAYEKAIELLIQQGREADAFHCCERLKSYTLLERLKQADATDDSSLPPARRQQLQDTLNQHRQNVAQLENRLRTALREQAYSDSQEGEQITRLQTELYNARMATVDAYRTLDTAKRLGQMTAADEANEFHDTGDLTRLQGWSNATNSMILYYICTEQRTWLLLLQPGQAAQWYELVAGGSAAPVAHRDEHAGLDRPGLNELLHVDDRTILQALSARELDEATTETLGKLYRCLIPAAARNVLEQQAGGCDHLIVIPDGPLHALPFDALVVREREIPVYLLDVGPPIAYVPSARVLERLSQRSNRASSSPRTALTLGNPDYSHVNGLLPALERGTASAVGPLLPISATGTESTVVAACFRAVKFEVEQLLGSNATEGRVRAAIEGRRFVHLACHGIAESLFGNQFGALIVASNPSTLNPSTPNPATQLQADDDGMLTLPEIAQLDLTAADLVVLSACRTNHGPQSRHEGTWALTRSVLAAGAGSVVATNWRIDDAASAELMSAMFTAIARQLNEQNEQEDSRNLGFARHLWKAKRQVRQQPSWQAPYYWAAFHYVGRN